MDFGIIPFSLSIPTYNDLQALLKSVNSNIVYTHCMGHVLNLLVSECSTKYINLAEDLFGLVEQHYEFYEKKKKNRFSENIKK